LRNGAETNAQGGLYGNALQAASQNGHREVVEMLLENGADVNMQGYYLQAATWNGHCDVVEVLLHKGVDINAQGGYYGNSLAGRVAEWPS